MNLVDYVETQMEDFKTTKFNLVDSLVLSQFVYLHFHKVVPEIAEEQEPVKIGEMLKAEHIPNMLHNVRDSESNRRLLLALGMSPRFRSILMCCYSDRFDITLQKQFAAVTYLLDEETAYIAYRGTDSTIVGWKEDFNMAFIYPVPAQEEGVSYLNAVAKRFPHRLLLGGHSKGGNIAVYSAMECDLAVKERIIGIYSHDGPGFRDEIFTSKKYTSIKEKIHKTLPQSSLVGMLLQQQEDYMVIKSNEFWIMQHDPFSWVIQNNEFQYLKGITKDAEYLNSIINQWLSSLDDEKRALFITTLFSVFESIGVVYFSDLTEDWHKKVAVAMQTLRGIDTQTGDFVFNTIRSLLALYVKNIRFFN